MARFFSVRSTRRVNGSNVVRYALVGMAGAALLCAATGDANAYSIKKTTRGDLVHWEQDTVDYTIDPSVDRNVANSNDATLSAMASWSGTVNAPELRPATSTVDAPTKPGFDRANGVFFVKGGYAPAGRALAITVLTYDNVSGRILDADVIVNGSYAFEVLAPTGNLSLGDSKAQAAHPSNTDGISHGGEEAVTVSSRDTVYDLHHVIAHELGHTLGMNDELGRKDALMYRYSAPNDATIREPAPDDIEGLAELYSSKLEGRGNGCGSATVAPKKPSGASSHVATFATLSLLLFLVLRAKSDKRARLAFVAAAAVATIAAVPSLSGKRGAGIASASESSESLRLGHARAKVLSTSIAIENGLFKTSYKLATTECRTASCPKGGYGTSWGGTIGNVTQEVGGYFAPAGGDEVDVSFATLPNALGPLTKPLAGRTEPIDASVVVLTRVR